MWGWSVCCVGVGIASRGLVCVCVCENGQQKKGEKNRLLCVATNPRALKILNTHTHTHWEMPLDLPTRLTSWIYFRSRPVLVCCFLFRKSFRVWETTNRHWIRWWQCPTKRHWRTQSKNRCEGLLKQRCVWIATCLSHSHSCRVEMLKRFTHTHLTISWYSRRL